MGISNVSININY